MRLIGTPQERFWARVDKSGSGDCWQWTGPANGSGYGSIAVRNRPVGAHRFSYELHFGGIPAGKFVCHSCDNRMCVNPKHLWLGSAQDNARDCATKGRQNGDAKAHRGETAPTAKLTWEQVEEIRRRHPQLPGRGRRPYEGSLRQTADEFGVTSSLLTRIIRNEGWLRDA